MPNFETHRKINYIMLLSFIFLYLYFGLDKYLPVVLNGRIILSFLISYVLGTELFTPDLDTKSTPSKRLGFIYLPLRWLYHHRGRLHNPFIGWIIQIIYLSLIGIIILIIANKLGYNFELPHTINTINIDYIIGSLIGLFLSNGLHIMADKFLSK